MSNTFVNRFLWTDLFMVSFFAKRFIIVVSFMNQFFCCPFVQETKFYEPIHEPIHMRAFAQGAVKQVPEEWVIHEHEQPHHCPVNGVLQKGPRVCAWGGVLLIERCFMCQTGSTTSDNGVISPVIQTTNGGRVPSSRPRTDVRPNGKDTRSNGEHKVERKRWVPTPCSVTMLHVPTGMW